MERLREPTYIPSGPHPVNIRLNELSDGLFGFRALSTYQYLESSGHINQAAMSAQMRPVLDKAAGSITKLDDFHRREFNEDMSYHVNREEAAQWGSTGGSGLYTNVRDWATWFESGASNNERLLFIAWNAGRIAAAQRRASTVRLFAEEREKTIAAVKDGIGFGKLHHEAEDKIPELRRTRVLLGDYMDMGAKDRSGYAQRGVNIIHVHEMGRRFNLPFFKAIYHHEFGHRIGRVDGIVYDETATDNFAQAVMLGNWREKSPDLGVYNNLKRVVAGMGLSQTRLQRLHSAQSYQAKQDELEQLRRSADTSRFTERRNAGIILEEVEANANRSNVESRYEAVEEACRLMLRSRTPALLVRDLASTDPRVARRYREFVIRRSAEAAARH